MQANLLLGNKKVAQETPENANPLFKLMQMNMSGQDNEDNTKSKAIEAGKELKPPKSTHLGFENEDAGSSRLDSFMNKSPQSEVEEDLLEPEVP